MQISGFVLPYFVYLGYVFWPKEIKSQALTQSGGTYDPISGICTRTAHATLKRNFVPEDVPLCTPRLRDNLSKKGAREVLYLVPRTRK